LRASSRMTAAATRPILCAAPMPTFATALRPAELAERLGSPARVAPALRAIHGAAGRGALPARVEGVAASVWTPFVRAHPLPAFEVVERRRGADGTVKLAVAFDGALTETVMIPGARRTTVCVSSQAGCTRACRFCATARLGFGRNLDAGEILMQYHLARLEAESAGAPPATNVVFMGMGEPLDNLDAVVRSIDVLTAAPAPGLSPRRITVSTSGVLPQIRPFLERSKAELALSLHATTDAQRTRLVPHNRSWPIAGLLCEAKAALAGSGRLLFVEYLLLGGENDLPEDAHRLVALLEGLPARVNLIPYNAVPGLPYASPAPDRAAAFAAILAEAGLRTMIRQPRGPDVAAACGQLAGPSSTGGTKARVRT
jgi:23S rRNA (adenine2503-C2)-methyltransferase